MICLQFIDLTTDNNGGEFDERDLDRVRADDHYLHGFMVICKMEKQAALTKLIACLKWRKEYGMNGMIDLKNGS